jgi:gluconolactonase
MLNPFKPLELIKAEVFTSMPKKFRNRSRTTWSDPNRQGAEVECFLEGPSFDREGNLWIVDIPFGRIFRISPQKEWDLVVQYDGWPNGLKFHKDGRAFITDYKKGLLALDPQTARLEPILETAYSEGFKGLNDLHFASNGDLYFTDQGQTGIADPTGRVYRLRADGALDRLCSNVPSPNGITLSTTEQHCYVAVTRSQQIWRLPLMADGSVSKTGVAIQLSGGNTWRSSPGRACVAWFRWPQPWRCRSRFWTARPFHVALAASGCAGSVVLAPTRAGGRAGRGSGCAARHH